MNPTIDVRVWRDARFAGVYVRVDTIAKYDAPIDGFRDWRNCNSYDLAKAAKIGDRQWVTNVALNHLTDWTAKISRHDLFGIDQKDLALAVLGAIYEWVRRYRTLERWLASHPRDERGRFARRLK